MTKTLPALCIAVALTLTACSSPGARTETGERTELTVFAAASLTQVFEDIAEEYEASAPAAAEVTFSFAGSSTLVSQISEGAPADVIATADEETMQDLVDDGLLADPPMVFASNTLALAVPESNPGQITGAQDLAGTDLVICAPVVPCGGATQQWAQRAGAALDPVSEENSVTDVLGKVRTGQADAGIVYVTDIARAGGAVTQIDLAGADEVVNEYPAAAVGGSQNRAEAEAFVEFLNSETSQQLLRAAGFAAP